MVIRGYKQPLIQEDMWDLNEVDSTAYINKSFMHFMQPELREARIRYEAKQKNRKNTDKAQDEAFKNGLSSGLGKGVSQDVLMMVKRFIIYCSLFIKYLLHLFHLRDQFPNNFFSLGGKGNERR